MHCQDKKINLPEAILALITLELLMNALGQYIRPDHLPPHNQTKQELLRGDRDRGLSGSMTETTLLQLHCLLIMD
ncbi:hypothetical protein V6N13_002275 [Hibiscus sabdariffa]